MAWRNRMLRFAGRHQDLCLVGITAVVLCLAPLFMKTTYIVHIGCMIGINIIVALGLYIVTGASGQINMGQYGFYCVGAYVAGSFTTQLGLGFWVSLAASIVLCGAIGLFVGSLALRVEGPYLALCTLAFGESVRLIINNSSHFGGPAGIMRIGKLSLFGKDITSKFGQYFFIIGFVIVVLILVNNLMRSRRGRRFQAIKDDAMAASVLGVSVKRTKVFAFCCSAILGGVGGCIYACYNGYINPTTFTQDLQVNYLLMIVLGGLGTQWGAVVGAALVTIFNELTRSTGQYQSLVTGCLMIVTILALRRGVVGTVTYQLQQRKIRKQHLKGKDTEKEPAKKSLGDS